VALGLLALAAVL